MEGGDEWKKSVGFPINYSPEHSGDDSDVVVLMRHPSSHSHHLLADGGDGAEADLLGTTPPRTLIRDKLKRKAIIDGSVSFRSNKDSPSHEPITTDRPRNTRLSLKIQRAKERDFKQSMDQREFKADSLPSPNPNRTSAIPTLVESCNRFMSLTSRLKCRQDQDVGDIDQPVERQADEEFPPSRVTFHKTFSMLINMGNIDKSCRRAISREEQVWQNELKDLIWLELQAKIAGRTLAEQDNFLCAQRGVVPAIIHNIMNYKFVNHNPCRRQARCKGAEDLREKSDSGAETENEGSWCCLSFNCRQCTSAVGCAMREVGALLDSYHNALRLYPSSQAMTTDHPLVATPLFNNRLKAMCMWYNTAMHMRLKMLAVRRMVRTMKMKMKRRGFTHLASTESDASRQSFDSPRPCQVKFNVSTPSSSNNSDSSGQTEIAKPPQTKTEGEKGKDIPPQHESEGDGDTKEGRGKDETDNRCFEKTEQSIPTTPEIIISEGYGTTDTAASSESGYTSGDQDTSRTDSVYSIGSLDDLTELRLLDKCPVSIYRSYHQEILKTQGVRRCMLFINKMRCNLLHKVYQTLEKPDGVSSDVYNAEELEEQGEVFDDTKEEEEKTDCHDEDAKKIYELRRYGCWSEECLSMRLPSYRNHFLLLSTICMEAVHDYLSLRLEDRPQNPSCLTVKQLIHELKEGLDIATESRAAFARNIEVAIAGQCASSDAKEDLCLVVRTFDATVETVLKQYLSYLRTMSEVEQMGKASLQAEWAFTARLAKRVRCAALLAPQTFSEIACNQLDRLHKQFQEKFERLAEFEKNEPDRDPKHFVYSICRAVQHIYASERDATLQAAHWARCLAARLARAHRPHQYATHTANIFNSLMRIRDLIVEQTNEILEHSRKHHLEDREAYRDSMEALGARVRELMLQIYRLGFELHKELYKFAQAPFLLVEEKTRRRPISLQPIRRQDFREAKRRPETMLIHQSFNPMIHKELHRFVHDSPRPPAPPAAHAHSSPPRSARFRLDRAESIGEDVETNAIDDRLFDNLNTIGENQTQSSIELLLMKGATTQEPEVVFRPLRPPTGCVTAEEKQRAMQVARAVVEFAKCWMQFVIEKCDKGRGLRPRWASQGLEFLMLACDPCNTKHLTEEEFEELKKKMDGCISHVIGSRPVTPRVIDPAESTHRRPRPRLHSPLPSAGRDSPRAAPAPPTPPAETESLFNFHGVDSAAHSARVLEAIARLEVARSEKLQAARAVGRVMEAAVNSYEPKLRQLKFKWQRGLKIGQGTFGKVYTVVNTETGQLLAMKEISIGAGDRRALQRAANELRVLEGVIHPHLVRYYGCELHREEMLLFMELCVEGSLEALIATSGALQEHMTRRYTKQLVSAVAELHARSIAHRDIKSGNIFLTNEGNCLKLGDFGCAVKIRANTTAAGELMGHVGTQAYMAPEVFMKPTGHGRAADVWSLGCVVAEMASGKRPFAEYDSNVQIMFVVGMGGRPNIADTLSEEGQAFCRACLTHEPEQRPRAEQLSLHHFLMLKTDDDCNCEPAFLIT